MRHIIAAFVSAAILAAAGVASAVTVVEHEDGGVGRLGFAADSGPISTLVVSAPVNIVGFGVDVDLREAGDLKFFIFDTDTSDVLFSSGPKAFDTSSGYKDTDPMSFTFVPGIAYAIGAIPTVNADWFVDIVPNFFDVYFFFANNQVISNAAAPVFDGVIDIFDVGTRLLVVEAPEPLSLSLLGVGLAGIGVARARRRRR